MPSTIHLILGSVAAQPRRVSKDAGYNVAERFTRPFAGTTIYFDIEVSDAAQGRCPRPAIMRGSPERRRREELMALKIYGIPRSRTARVLWMAKELGLEFENIPVDNQGGSRTSDFLKINPNGHIPAIDDDGTVVWESMAINLYLAKKYSPASLYPTRLEDETRAWQWSFWGMTEVERPLLTALFHRAIYPEDKRDAKLADDSERQLAAPLKVLDGAVAHTSYLLGEDFTVADLNVASILSWARPARIDLSRVPKMADWFTRCAERPAARAARDLQR
jgi:glutathione S-transferase